jgi:hypothetical protein
MQKRFVSGHRFSDDVNARKGADFGIAKAMP